MKQEITLEKLEMKNKFSGAQNLYAYAISSIKSTIHQVNAAINETLSTIGDVACECSNLGDCTYFVRDRLTSRRSQANWVGLVTPKMLPQTHKNEIAYVQQRSEEWHQMRSSFRVTGSTIRNALGMRTVKDQKQHFDKVMHGKEPIFSDDVLQRMKHGSDNESNVIATLTSMIMPFLYPRLCYV